MSGTVGEMKQAITECLHMRYPRGRTESGISTICFRGRTGADGQPLGGMGGWAKFKKALDELVEEGKIAPHGDDGHGQVVFHYKTNDQPPVVGLVEEIKFNITECLCGTDSKSLVQVGIERTCLDVDGPNGLPLVEAGSAADIKKALDELVAEGRIDAYMEELDGRQMMHYRAKRYGSATSNRPTP